MACYRPLKAYRAPGGQISFNSKEGWSDRPLELPCGQCIGCRLARAREWALRCCHEAMLYRYNSFVTLTYDQVHLPEGGSLVTRDWQLFAKRLRKRLGPFRFFMCGEYGDHTQRPHYHALLFGVDFHHDRYVWRRKRDYALYRSPTLEELWPVGQSEIGNVTYRTCEYVSRYVIKKQTGVSGKAFYGQRKPPFVLMSRGGRGGEGGIGKRFVEKFKSDVYPRDEVIHEGRRFRPPRFYDAQLEESELQELKAKRRKKVSREDMTPERLRTREKVDEARISILGSRE